VTQTIPKSAAELEAMLGDRDFLVKVVKTPAQLGEFITNYTQSQMAKHGDTIETVVREQSQLAVAEMLKNNGAMLRGRPSVGSKATGTRRGVGSVLDAEFTDTADFFASINPKNQDRDRWSRIKNDYSTAAPAAGGFLVPEKTRAELLSNSLESSIMRPDATVIPMDVPRVPIPCVDETTHSGSVYGGITGTWVAEGAALPESEARFGRVVLDASKLVTYCEAPSELPQDAPAAFGAFIDRTMPEALGFFADYAYLRGTGVGQPLGILDSANTALVAVAKETSQTADMIVWENIVKMYARMLPSSLKRAKWVASIDTFPQLATMALAVGTGGSAVWLNNGAAGPPMTIMGCPVVFTEKVPTVGDQGDISFIDPRHYLIGDRGEMRVESSIHYKFGNDVISYRVIERGDGRPWMKSAVTPANGSSSTLSPYVTLAERA
jgi:HK97 family phage major capsid protein